MNLEEFNKQEVSKLLGAYLDKFPFMDTERQLLILIAVSCFKTYDVVSKMYADLCTLNNLKID